MRLIDADRFDRRLAAAEFDAALLEADDRDEPFEHQAMYYSTQSFRDVMKYQPTVDAVPVVHAKWKDNGNDTISCSRCATWFQKEREPYLRFCGYCGAKMDGEENANN